MTEWKVNMLTADIRDPSAELLTDRYAKLESHYDRIRSMAEDGWELVSTTPITKNGNTVQLLFMFKRPAGY